MAVFDQHHQIRSLDHIIMARFEYFIITFHSLYEVKNQYSEILHPAALYFLFFVSVFMSFKSCLLMLCVSVCPINCLVLFLMLQGEAKDNFQIKTLTNVVRMT